MTYLASTNSAIETHKKAMAIVSQTCMCSGSTNDHIPAFVLSGFLNKMLIPNLEYNNKKLIPKNCSISFFFYFTKSVEIETLPSVMKGIVKSIAVLRA